MVSKKKYYTNGQITKRFNPGEEPLGFYPGNNRKGIKTFKSPGNKGMKYFHNDFKEVFAYDCPEGFVAGRLPFTEEHKKKISKALSGFKHSEESKEKNRRWHLTHKYINQAWNKGKKLGPRSLEVKEKIRQKTIGKKHGPRSNEAKIKSTETRRIHHSFNTSKPENEVYDYLVKIFSKEDIFREYHEERYPFNSDFYIKSKDLFLELNFHWTHGNKPFDKNDSECLKELAVWKEKAKTSKFYSIAIDTWTRRDVIKRETAERNKLNYLVVYSLQELYNIIK